MTQPGPQANVAAIVAVLAELSETRRAVDQLEYRVVDLVRSTGVTWQMIGDELGMSRQAARQRFDQPRRRRRS